MLLASSALLAQGDDFSVESQIHSGVPDVRQIVESSIEVTQRQWQERLHSTYVERDESRRLDSAGRVKSEEVEVSKTILVNGVPFEQLLERNGRSPSAEEARKQKEKLYKLERETSEQRAERIRKQEEETLSLVREVPKACDFQFVGEEVVNGGRPMCCNRHLAPTTMPKESTAACSQGRRQVLDRQTGPRMDQGRFRPPHFA